MLSKRRAVRERLFFYGQKGQKTENDEKNRLEPEVKSLLSGIGCSLVEWNLSRHKGSVRARAVIYHPEGTGLDLCAKASRLIQPRLEVLLGLEDVPLEITSPGIDRDIKSTAEYGIFKGRGARLYSRSRTDWVTGILEGLDGDTVLVKTVSGMERVATDDIAKAKLDHSQEVR